MNRIYSKTALLAVVVFVMSGCGLSPQQKQHIESFAMSTEAVSTIARDQFTETRSNIIELRKRTVVLSGNNPPKELDLDGGLNVEGIAARLAAVKALYAYGQTLEKLSSNDKSDDLGASANEFVTQLEASIQAKDTDYALTDDQKGALASIIAVPGKLYLEHNKKKSIKQLVLAYKDEVETLADLLVDDMVLSQGSLCLNGKSSVSKRSGVIDIYCTEAKNLYRKSSLYLKRKSKTDLEFYEREYAYTSLQLAQSSLDQIATYSKKSGAVLKSLSEANAKIVAVIEDDEFDVKELKAFSKDVKEFVNAIEALGES